MADSNETRHIAPSGSGSLPVPDGSLQPGQVLQNRYRILGVIGVGGMGAVYQARDQHFQDVTRLCAVKEMINLQSDQGLREQTLRNFKREAELLATLSHPAIPQIFDFFSFGDRAYLVMEFIQGKDLEAIMNSTSQFLPTEQVVQWGVEICDVLNYLHSHKPDPIIFRDMKPSNVMIDHHRRVRLIDFGIARTFAVGQAGTTIGTEGYSPPEQYKGEATSAADIYALGATMHHLLTRRDPRLEPPFSFEQAPISSINPSVPEEVSAVVMRALSYDPKQRYSSAEAMKQSLDATLGARAVVVAPQTQPSAPSAVPQAGVGLFAEETAAASSPARQESARAGSAASTILPLWTFQVEDAVRSTPLIHNGVLYVGSYDNNLWALDAKSGGLRWKHATEGGIGSSPSYLGGSIFIGSTDQRLHALDAATGKSQWTFKTDGKIYSTPRTHAGHVFFGSDDGNFYAIKPGSASAREIWRYQVMESIRSSPVVSNELIFVGADSGELICFNFDGSMRWRYHTKRQIISSPIVVDGVIYVGSNDWHCYALDINGGAALWRFRTRGAVVSRPVFGDGRVYFGSADGTFYAVDALSGREAWKFMVGQPVTSSPAFNREAVYFGGADGGVYCLHARTGELLWRFGTRGPVLSSPVFADDILYIGSDDKTVYALPG